MERKENDFCVFDSNDGVVCERKKREEERKSEREEKKGGLFNRVEKKVRKSQSS